MPETLTMEPQLDAIAAEPEPVGDPNRVTNAILEFCKHNRDHAQTQTQDLYDRILRARKLYRCENTAPAPTLKDAEKQGTDITLPEAANQLDTAKGTFYSNLFANNEIYKLVAEGDETQANADTTKALLDAQLRAKQYTTEIERFFHRFLAHPIAGMKACIEFVEEPDYRRITLPIEDVGNFLLQQARLGRTTSKIWDSQTDTDPVTGEEFATEQLWESTGTVQRVYCYSATVDARNLCFGDTQRGSVDQQPSIHELRILNSDELRDNPAFLDADLLGEPDAHGQKTAMRVNDNPPASNGENKNFREWKVWESWSSLPITKWLKDDVFNAYDWEAFCDYHKIDMAEAGIPQKWRVVHCDSVSSEARGLKHGVALQITPNYLLDRQKYPYDVASYIDGDGELIGQSQLERIEPLANSYNAMHNMFADNLRMRLYQSMIYDKSMELDDAALRKMFATRYGVMPIDANGNLKDMLMFLSEVIPDMTGSALSGLNMYSGLLQNYGVPAVVQGIAKSETATQDTINNVRGQQKVDSPFRRAVQNVIVKQVEKCIGMTYRWFDTPQYITVAGEGGARLAKEAKYVTPREITNRVKVVPLATFDFVDRPIKAQQLLAALNIAAAVVPPPVVIRLLGKALEYQGLDREVIDEVTNNLGLGTDPNDEINVMLTNPHTRIEVRQDDNHLECLRIASLAAMQYPQLQGQENFQAYVSKHTMFFQQMMAMPMVAGPQGKPAQAPADAGPKSQEGATKQGAQLESAPDGGEAAVGMTGQGGMGAVTGAPLPSRVQGTLAKGAGA